jgi:hypothetical protein
LIFVAFQFSRRIRDFGFDDGAGAITAYVSALTTKNRMSPPNGDHE